MRVSNFKVINLAFIKIAIVDSSGFISLAFINLNYHFKYEYEKFITELY